MWDALDVNGDGVLTKQELKDYIIKNLGPCRAPISEEEEDSVEEFLEFEWGKFMEYDANGDGKISKEEFKTYVDENGW